MYLEALLVAGGSATCVGALRDMSRSQPLEAQRGHPTTWHGCFPVRIHTAFIGCWFFGSPSSSQVCQHCAVRARHIAAMVGAATAAGLAPLSAPVPSASAQPCPDVEVVFARGTTEEPGVGPTGQAFVDALRARIGTKSMGVYPVDYPATTDFPTALDGIRDASAHVESTATNCPNTKMVLGGFSQGAAVMGFVTANVIPDGAPEGVPNPMPPDVARPCRRGRTVRKTKRPVHASDQSADDRRSARRMRPRPSICASPMTSFVRAEGTSTRTCSTRRPGWLTRQRLSPRVASWQSRALPHHRKRLRLPHRRSTPLLRAPPQPPAPAAPPRIACACPTAVQRTSTASPRDFVEV